MTTHSINHTLRAIHISRSELPGYVLIVLWVLTMISLPILRWIFGDVVLPIGTNTAAVFQGSAVFVLVWQQWGFQRTMNTFALVAIVTWVAEAIGQTTGFPFGAYHYTDILQPQILNVPLLIPIAWFMLLPSAWVMGQQIIGKQDTWQKRTAFISISAAALTAWDLFLDPQMVAWRFWLWDNPNGAYFGIPISNYIGWFLVAALVTFLAQPAPLKPMPLALIYAIVWFLQSIGQAVFWGQIGPALVGCAAMGGILLLAYWCNWERSR
jgi:lycopene beta-cyclase